MSMHNLLELDDFDNPYNKSPARSNPKPKPRITANGENQPRPKPRRRVERDVDEVMSMSSVSSGDHIVNAAFDNPVFRGDQDEITTKKQKKGDAKNRVLSSESESERTQPKSEQRRKLSKSNHSKGKHGRNYMEEHENSTSAWEEEETYLTIQNEVPTPRSRRNEIKSPSVKSRQLANTTPVEELMQLDNSKKAKKEDHTSINIADEIAEKDSKKSTEKTKSSKPRLVERWKSFLKSGQSQSQSVDKAETNTEKTIDKSKKEEKAKTPAKHKNDKEETRIEIPSENSSSEDETDIDTTREEIQNEKTPPSNKPEELKTLKKLVEPSKTEKSKLRFNIRSKSLRRQERLEKQTDEDHIQEIQQQTPETVIKPPRRKRTEKPYSSNSQHLLFGITIHSSDLLPMDPNVLHPVVKVTLMNQEGKLLHRTSGFRAIDNRGSIDDGLDSSRTEHPEDTRRKRKGRSSGEKHLSQSDSIHPIMTQPFKMSHINPTFVPAWNELLLFEEPFERFVDESANVIVFFEVMDFLPMGRTAEIPTPGYHGSQDGWHKVCWAFLKPVGANGVFNVERKLRLQLYKPVKLRNKDILNAPEVFSWWKSGKREKLQNTTLYVTIKGINPPRTKASLNQLLTMRKDDLTEAIIESQLAAKKSSKKLKKGKSLEKAVEPIDIRNQINWARLEGQSCKVPNKLVASLPASQIQSLNLNVSGNVHCLKFSPCGLKLAAGLDTDELHAVLVFDIPSGNLLRCMKNHHGLIYDLSWKQMDVDDNSYVTYLASASADSTAIVWQMQNNDENSFKMIKILNHPSYVYCTKFHPTHPSILVTGCFDFIIRIWDIKNTNSTNSQRRTSIQSSLQDSCPLFILDRHYSFVNALLFDYTGSFLFSGDGNSCLYKWSIKSPSKRKSWKIDRDVKLTETGNIPINSLSLHPNGNRLLVHLRDNCLKILDVATLIQIQSFSGIVNDKLQIRSCFSPCGNLVLSGSEDPTICIWDADTGAIVQFISPKNHPNCFVTSIDYHPFDFYLVAGLASAICEPSPILLYHYETPKIRNIALVQSSITKFKTNLRKKQSQSVQENDDSSVRKNVTFASARGDSSEKFLNIINKLDKALKDVQDPTRNHSSSKAPSLTRSLTFDVITPPNKPSEPNNNVESQNQPQKDRHFSEADIGTNVPKNKQKSRSPRAYIENRLEELIQPHTVDQNESQDRNEIEQVAKSNEVEDPMLLSPKNLPKPKRRPQSSKIPIRCQPESPKKDLGERSSSTPTSESSPVSKRKTNNQAEQKITADIHATSKQKQRQPAIPVKQLRKNSNK